MTPIKLSFIYGSSYLAGSYGHYAASALAGNAVARSVAGGVLPLAGPSMYAALTPQWAGTLLGLLEVLLVPIPLVFYRYGGRIRARSRVIREMREEQQRGERRRERMLARAARRQAEEGDSGGGDDGGGPKGLEEMKDAERGAGVSLAVPEEKTGTAGR